MATTPTKANYPTELRLPNGEILKVAESPELKTFFDQTVSAAASIEKDKLYATLETERAKTTEALSTVDKMNREAKEWAVLIQNQEKAHNDEQLRLKAELDALAAKAAATTHTPDQLAQMMSKVFQEQLQPLREALTTTEQKTAELERIRIANYLQSKRVELGDTVIPELVAGNTIAEIDASVALATQMRQRYAPVVTQTNTTQQPETPGQPVVQNPTTIQPASGYVPNGSVMPPHTQENPLLQGEQQVNTQATPPATPQPVVQPVVVPYVGTHANPDQTSLPNIAAMSEAEFKRSRESVLEQLRGTYK